VVFGGVEGIYMKEMNKENCIKTICSLPIDFKIRGKSSLELLQNSKFKDFCNDIASKDIACYLSYNKNLIHHWQIWSHDKRTVGCYLNINSNEYFVSVLNKEGKVNYSKSFPTAEEACAVFILIEVNEILNIRNDFLNYL